MGRAEGLDMSLRILALLALSSLVGCVAAGDEDFEDGGDSAEESVDSSEDGLNKAVFAGKNGERCMESAFNCALRPKGGNEIVPPSGELWEVDQNEPVRDGHGDVMIMNTTNHLRFNYGQTRHMKGRTYVYARSTSNGSSGWFPIDAVKKENSLRKRVGEVNARDTGGERMGCYEVRRSHNEKIELKKVVFDSEATHERAGDYMSLPRKNGGRYANLAFNVPGYGLGAPAIDIFPAGTKFQRVDVPTKSGRPSITIPLWVKDSKGRYRKRSGSMTFIYGYVDTDVGARRFGWMALDALKASSGCR